MGIVVLNIICKIGVCVTHISIVNILHKSIWLYNKKFYT